MKKKTKTLKRPRWNLQRTVIALLAFLMLVTSITPLLAMEEPPKLNIVIDAGHGGSVEQNIAKNQAVGAEYGGLAEKDLTLKIASFLKEELDSYNVNVYLTRSDDSQSLTLKERAEIAKQYDADVVLSLHLNACDLHNSNGAEVYVPNGKKYREDMNLLGRQILNNLNALGLKNNGTFIKQLKDQEGNIEYYNDGYPKDYYGIIRENYLLNIPAIIIEHGYLDNKQDRENRFRTDEQLRAIAYADAKAIIDYYGLTKKVVIPKIDIKEKKPGIIGLLKEIVGNFKD